MSTRASEHHLMQRAIAAAAGARSRTSPNPWVGCVIETPGGDTFEGATEPPGGPHAEVVALRAAGARAEGATLFSTLEPCSHHGRTPPCADALIAAGVARVVVGIEDPDPHVGGRGHRPAARRGHRGRRSACAPTRCGPSSRRTSSTAAPAGPRSCSSWPPRSTAAPRRPTARASGSPASAARPMPTGCGPRATRCSSAPAPCGPTTRRSPSATSRAATRCGSCSATRRRTPRCTRALELDGDLDDVLDELGRQGVVQVLVEGGATVAARLPPRRPRRSLRAVPRARAVRRRRRPTAVRRPRRADHRRRVARAASSSVDRLGDDLRIELGGA